MCRMKLEPSFLLCIKINSKWNKTFNIKPEIMKLLGEKVENIQDASIGKDFLNRMPITHKIRPTIDKWNFTKSKSFWACVNLLHFAKWTLYQIVL